MPQVETDFATAHLTFEGFKFDLESIPTNKQAAEDAADSMPTFRMAAVMLRFDDKELEHVVRRDPEAFMELLECITSTIQARKGRLKVLEMAFCRLNVALERYVTSEPGGEGSEP